MPNRDKQRTIKLYFSLNIWPSDSVAFDSSFVQIHIISYDCNLFAGHEYSDDTNMSCTDTDECDVGTETNNCNEFAAWENTVWSFNCHCIVVTIKYVNSIPLAEKHITLSKISTVYLTFCPHSEKLEFTIFK